MNSQKRVTNLFEQLCALADRTGNRNNPILSVSQNHPRKKRNIEQRIKEIIKVPSIIEEFDCLDVEDKRFVLNFARSQKSYMAGEYTGCLVNIYNALNKNNISENARDVIRKTGLTLGVISCYKGWGKGDRKNRFGRMYIEENDRRELVTNANNNLESEGGFNYVLSLAIEVRPEIFENLVFNTQYKINQKRYEDNMVSELISCHDRFEEEGTCNFGKSYLYSIDRRELITNPNSNLKSEGGFYYVLSLAVKQKPKIFSDLIPSIQKMIKL